MEPILTEQRSDRLGDYTERWMCEVPEMGVRYRVIEQEWNNDYTERTIKRIEFA